MWGGRGGSNDKLYGNLGIDEYVYSYNNSQDKIFQAGNEDTVNLVNISLDQITMAEITDNSVNLQFTDGGSLTIFGQVSNFKLGDAIYHADYINLRLKFLRVTSNLTCKNVSFLLSALLLWLKIFS